MARVGWIRTSDFDCPLAVKLYALFSRPIGRFSARFLSLLDFLASLGSSSYLVGWVGALGKLLGLLSLQLWLGLKVSGFFLEDREEFFPSKYLTFSLCSILLSGPQIRRPACWGLWI